MNQEPLPMAETSQFYLPTSFDKNKVLNIKFDAVSSFSLNPDHKKRRPVTYYSFEGYKCKYIV